MIISEKGLQLICSFEGLRLIAYKDTGGVWTIGYGTIEYPDGTPVKQGDSCNTTQANAWLQWEVEKKTAALNTLIKSKVNQNQFDALCSFAYNLGIRAFKGSTLRRKVNKAPNDPAIYLEFMKWDHDDGKVIAGLTRRRKAEADLYFSELL